MTNESTKTIPTGRANLARLINASGDVIQIDDAVKLFGVSRTKAAKALSRWKSQGWLQRIGPGAYVSVPVESALSDAVVEDPWVLVPALFGNCYIGGRTAAEHWDLTEQIFRDIVVITEMTVRSRTHERNGIIFTLKHVQSDQIFGTKTVWRGRSKIAVSDIHRTIIDMLAYPELGGGIQHTRDCFREYLQRGDRDLNTLLRYGDRVGNGAIFKRLGFLAERENLPDDFLEECAQRLTKGNAKLDPRLSADRLITRWRLQVPSSWAGATS